MTDNSNISYLNKSFSQFKDNLINYAKVYFPTVYNDFTEASPGSLFIEMAAYVGDVMSFYLDTQVQETFLLYAQQKSNLYALAYMMGYRPKVSYASSTLIDVFQLIPSINGFPDYNYALIVPANTQVTSADGIAFITTEEVDFRNTDNTELNWVNSNYYLLKKQVRVISAAIQSVTLNFPTPQKFSIQTIRDTNILQILDATDSQGNRWYEVPYLAQSTVFDRIVNPTAQSDGVPYLIQLRRTPRRFVSRFLDDNELQLEFGAGVSNKSDNNILPNLDNIDLGLVPGISDLYKNYNKASVFYTQEYGIAPVGDLTVRYLTGGGINSNVAANTLTTISSIGAYFPSGVTGNLADTIKASLASDNSTPGNGGRSGDTIEEIRKNSFYAYQSQLRAVTREDYMVRALSLPSEYGSISKVYVTQDVVRDTDTINGLGTSTVAFREERNPLSLDLYVLSYTNQKQLTTASTTLKQNLATYLNEFRMVTDAINIKDAFYINIGVNFDISIVKGFNNGEVLTACVNKLKDHFNIEKWNINQPIVLSEIISALLQTKGVSNVIKIEIVNKYGGNYSQYAYDIDKAIKQGNVYPSIDPSIFEVRFPDIDIQGRIV